MANIWVRVFSPEPTRRTVFSENPSTHEMPPPNAPAISYFSVLFTLELMREFVRQTNRYARYFIRSNALRRNSRARYWKNLTIETFRKFLAIIYNIGLIKKPGIAEYWNKHLPSQSSGWFNRVMSRNKFQNILKFLHISDHRHDHPRQHPGYDPASRFRPLLKFANDRFLRFLTPDRNLCIDETLVQSRGHNVMRQYIPSKRARFGVKLWVLSEAGSGYILHMDVYRGRLFDPVQAGQLQGTDVVCRLLQKSDLFNKGYHVFCDNFFTSLHLGHRLLQLGTYLTGTLRSNRPMPRTIKNANPDPQTPVYMRRGETLCMAHKDQPEKKTVRLMSTLLPAQELGNGRPKIVHMYNKYMGAIDQADASISIYGNQRKNRKTWKKVLINLLHRILHNAYILYCKNTSDTPVLSRLKFIQQVIESLSGISQQPVPRCRRQRVRVESIPGGREKDCCVCSNRGQGRRRRSRTTCALCGRGLHRFCVPRHIGCIEM